jgi:hypothetical protein
MTSMITYINVYVPKLPCLCTPQKCLMASTNFLPCCSTQKKNRMTKKKRNWALYPAAWATLALFPHFFHFFPIFTRFFEKRVLFSLCKKSRFFFFEKIGKLKKSRFFRVLPIKRRFLLLGLTLVTHATACISSTCVPPTIWKITCPSKNDLG